MESVIKWKSDRKIKKTKSCGAVSLIPFYDYLRRSSAGDHERGSTRDRDLTRRGLMYWRILMSLKFSLGLPRDIGIFHSVSATFEGNKKQLSLILIYSLIDLKGQ